MPYTFFPEHIYLQVNGDQIEMMHEGELLLTMNAEEARSNAADLLAAANRADGENPRWRVGRKVPINIYCDDRPICQCHSGVDAEAIVDAMNVQYLRKAKPRPKQ